MATAPTGDVPTIPERVLKTLLLTDLVDSTTLVDSAGDYRSAELFEQHDLIARDLLVKHNGIEIDKTDGFLFLFDRPIDAALYAVALHDALTDLSTEFGVRVTARAGIHLGEVMLRRNRPEYVARGAKPLEVEGLAKPMAARIMSLAQGTQTLMTRSAFDVARRAAVGHPDAPDDIQWIDHGAYQFKGIAEAQPVGEVGRAGRAPLAAPPNSEKAWRVAPRYGEEAVGWRPAVGLTVPGRHGWMLKRKIGEADSREVWLARRKKTVSSMDATIGQDERVADRTRPDERAFLLCLTHHASDTDEDSTCWQLADPMACLVITSGEQQGTHAVLTKKPLACGRYLTVDLQINDPKVSRRHCEIRCTDRGYAIRELRTRNGVFVNGTRIDSEQQLQNGDHIRVGGTDLTFYIDDERK